MSSTDEHKWYHHPKEAPSLHMWVLSQMTLGAGIAAVVFFGTIAVILIIRAISYLLPEDPYAALDAGQAMLTMIG